MIGAIGKPGLWIGTPYARPENSLVFNGIGGTPAGHNSGLVNPMKCQIIPDIIPSTATARQF
ncbi:hypothetical protein MPLB_1510034 [Mesorhizobium sp. ORS 3324]|nr:hypothetical protein MPLB_1510034 [Mesorhizobium sp. ORS 3324]